MLTTVKMLMALLAGGSTLAIATQGQFAQGQVAQDQVAQGQVAPVQPTYAEQRAQFGVQVPALSPNDTVAGAVVQWKTLAQANGAASFSEYATFLLAHPGWPNEAGNRRAAEKALLAGGWAPGLAASYFRRFAPLTGAGAVRAAQAFMATGSSAEANAAARAAWTTGTLSSDDEAALLGQFAAALTLDDQDRRMDVLLWQGALSSAARQLALTSSARRDAFAARLAFRSNAPEAAALATLASPARDADAGYVADKATWYKLNGASGTARTLLANRPLLAVRPGNVEKWYELLLDTAKGAAAEGQYDLAFRIAARVDDAYPLGTEIAAQSYGERDDYTSLVWFAGQTALKQLARPGDAVPMFDRYAKGSRQPQTQSKGIYWAGRAAQTAGRSADATAYYTRATGFGDQFYGQLATEQLGLALPPPSLAAPKPVEPVTRNAFYARETVRAAQYLGTIGDHESQSAFVRQIATDAKSDSDHALANQLAVALGRPDLGVMVGRSALANGLSDYRATGYPSVPVPAGKESDWTIIHAIARQESQFDRAAVSHAGARGLMQLMPGTAREQAGKLGMSYDVAALTADTGYNINLGSAYFGRVYATFGSFPLAIAAYNAGPGNVNKWLRANGDPRLGTIDMVDWIEAIPIYETKNYVQRVLENVVVYDLMNPARSRSSGRARLGWYLGRGTGGGPVMAGAAWSAATP